MNFDRVRMGSAVLGDSTIYEVFDPPWWKFWRFFIWHFLSSGHAKGYVTISKKDPDGVIRVHKFRARSVNKTDGKTFTVLH